VIFQVQLEQSSYRASAAFAGYAIVRQLKKEYTTMSPREGRSLEKLVERLEKALSSSENVKIESPKKLIDIVTGRKREHDVVITIDQGHHHVLISMECRERTRKVGSPQIEAFSKKCDHTGIDQGVIVSTSGFTKPALKKAKMEGIRCLSLGEALGFNWMIATSLFSRQAHLIHTDWIILCDETPTDFDMKKFRIEDADGNEISDTTLNSNVVKRFDQSQYLFDDRNEIIGTMEFDGSGLSLVSEEGDHRYTIKKLIAHARFKFIIAQEPFTLLRYTDEDVDKHLADAALARFEMGEIRGQLAVIREPNGHTRITFIPDEGSDGLSFRKMSELPGA
jgi:hypothetical protein